MANPNPPVATRFKKGQSGNPSGKPKVPDHLRDVKQFTAEEVNRTIAKYMRLSRNELAEINNNGDLPGFEAVICSIILQAHKSGDFSRLEFCLNRAGLKLRLPEEASANDALKILMGG